MQIHVELTMVTWGDIKTKLGIKYLWIDDKRKEAKPTQHIIYMIFSCIAGLTAFVYSGIHAIFP